MNALGLGCMHGIDENDLEWLWRDAFIIFNTLIFETLELLLYSRLIINESLKNLSHFQLIKIA